jgi:hypothetical protein
LLLGLVVLAVLARWFGRRRGRGRPWDDPAARRRWWLAVAPGGACADPPRVLCTMRLDANARLHVVEWDGARVLVAVTPGAAPRVLDRRVASPASPGPQDGS